MPSPRDDKSTQPEKRRAHRCPTAGQNARIHRGIDACGGPALRCAAVSWRSAIRIAGGTILCGALVCACGNAVVARHELKPGVPTASSTTQLTETLTDTAVLRAWRAAEVAFHDAAESSNPDFPALSSTMVDPQLARARAFLAEMRQSGNVAVGRTDLGDPTVVSIVGVRAVVVSCIHGGEIEVDGTTRRPVAGVLGEATFEEVTSQELLTSSGWRLADQSVAVGGCG